MEILPIGSIIESDQPIFGPNIFNLAQLKRAAFPVPEGLAVSPPDFELNTVLANHRYPNGEVFEQSLKSLKNEVADIPLPQKLDGELKQQKLLLEGVVFKKKHELWQRLLQLWVEEIRSKIWREGFTQNLISRLTPQVILFLNKKSTQVTAYYDPDLSEVVIKSEKKLEPKTLKEIDTLVLKANKRLFLPQVYTFLVEKGVYLISVAPFTQTIKSTTVQEVVIPKAEQKKIIKSAVKVLLDFSGGRGISDRVDGVLIQPGVDWDLDQIVLRAAEAEEAAGGRPIILLLPDGKEDIRGCLRLLRQKGLLELAVTAYLFLREKKNLPNIQFGLPYVRSGGEFLQLKKELGQKVGMKDIRIWVELAVPENIINLEEYLKAGFDGAIVNLDEMAGLLGGYAAEAGEFYKAEVTAVSRFVIPAVKKLHQARIPVIARGGLVFHPDILQLLIEAGVWGVVANNLIEAESAHEHLSWVEKRIVERRFSFRTD